MSMNSLKLNLPGLGGSNTRKSNGVSTQAKRNLSNSSAASSSTHFQLSGKKGFGFVSGQFVTKGSNKFNYDAQRAYYNSRSGGVSRRTYTPSYGMGMNQSIMPNFGYSSGMNFMNSLQMGMQLGKQTFSFLNNIGVINTNNTTSTLSNSSALANATASLGVTSSNVGSAAISATMTGMSSANDAVSLRNAIVSANSTLSSMQAQTGIYNNQATKAKELIDSQGTLTTQTKQAEADTKSKSDALSDAKREFDGTKAGRNNVLNEVHNLDAKYGDAVEKYTAAHDGCVSAKSTYTEATNVTSQCNADYQSAKAAYDNTPETIKDANGNDIPNPAKARAKKVMDNAELRLNQAKEKEKTAEENMEKAEKAENDAKQIKEDLYEQLGDKKAEADKLEEKLSKAQKLVDTKNEAVSKAQANVEIAKEKEAFVNSQVDAAQSAIDDNKQFNKDIETLEKEIKDQNKRLISMEEKAASYDEKINSGINKNNERYDNLDTNNNGSIDDGETNKHKTRKMENTNAKVKDNINQRNALDPNYEFTQWKNETLMTQTPTIINGEQYRKGTFNGTEVYYRGNMPIDAETYNRALGISS